MKNKMIAAGLLGISGAAFAQSSPGTSVELYGVFDNALRSSTNASENGGKYNGFSQGLFNGDRFGFRGSENIDGSTSAIFDLEGGFVGGTGTSDQQGQLFGRQSWVGLKGKWGQLTLGRQYGTFSDVIGVGDFFGAGHGGLVYNNGKGNYGSNAAETNFFLQQSAIRWDNSVKYEGTFSGVTVGAMAVLGGDAGQGSGNDMYSGRIGYTMGPLTATVGYQTEKDLTAKHHNDSGFGAKYDLGGKDALYAFYFHSKFGTNFTPINATNSEMTPGAFGRTDDIAQLGWSHYVTPSLALTGLYYYDHAQNVAAAGDSGTRNGVVGIADYYFSQRTDVYFAAAYTRFEGALKDFKGGGDAVVDQNASGSGVFNGNYGNVSSLMLGIRHRF